MTATMAQRELLIGVLPGETRVALIEDGCLAELTVERADLTSVVGDVYLGRIGKKVPGLDAAFVEIGLGRAGFLPEPKAGEGEAVVVQAVRDPVAGKGARLARAIVLEGGMLSYALRAKGAATLPDGIDKAARRRLASAAAELPDSGRGIVLRLPAIAAEPSALAREAESLRAAWQEIEQRATSAHAPAKLRAESALALRAVRDAPSDVTRIAVDDVDAFLAIQGYARLHRPDLFDRVARHIGPSDIFAAPEVLDGIETALAAVVALPSGGRIALAETPALVAVDVDTGADRGSGGGEETAYRVNLEAAAEIARQLRLRNLAGLIAIDFVPMRKPAHRRAVLAALARAAAADSCGLEIAGFTRLGLVEATRQRRGPSLADALLAPAAPRRRSPVAIAFESLRAILVEARARPGAAPALRAAPEVAAALEGVAASARMDVEKRLGRALVVRADPSLAPDGFAFEGTAAATRPQAR